MKKLFFLALMTTALSMTLTSCGGKDKKDGDEGDMEDMTLVVAPAEVA